MKEIEYYRDCESHCCGAAIVRGQPDTEKLMCSECTYYCRPVRKKQIKIKEGKYAKNTTNI